MSGSDRASQDALIERLRLYGQSQRLAILTLLVQGPCSVSAIERVTGIGQPALSQQLGELRRAGLIASTRVAREVSYDFASGSERARAIIILTLLDPALPQNANPSAIRFPARGGAHFASILPD
ncbi:ArsR/SmtB family transcription factor [Asaia krungthepensis]|uniref:ArsR family transcriptional regulator n=1 Tax=Asaia krungthepensis NRIC 0535 TaxID=1307925 RepID=A0ABQ0Q6Q3_9PROT|nr:metalloregulator ArsR/SmtB family transcription factor [Asaia krungthepensis]GBQ93762.1 ArsR family transcriptional regulator [Asaia krungthepensis NRIC 0535]